MAKTKLMKEIKGNHKIKSKVKENCINCTRVLNGRKCPYQKDNDGHFCKYYHDVSNWG